MELTSKIGIGTAETSESGPQRHRNQDRRDIGVRADAEVKEEGACPGGRLSPVHGTACEFSGVSTAPPQPAPRIQSPLATGRRS